jgi:intergrase/recombinase
MEFLKMFISEYGTVIMYSLLCGVFAYLGTLAKKLADKYLDTKIKRDVARTVVQAVEQVYHDLHGDEKLNKALTSMSEILAEKGITISDLEMRMLLEAAVGEFNENFTGTSVEVKE